MSNDYPEIHPDFLNLVERYRVDPRFYGKEMDRERCIDYLHELNSWVQMVKKPPEIQAVLLAGSFSSLKAETPDLSPVNHGPWYWGSREGGSDMDVLFIYSSNIRGLLKLKWQDFNLSERELVHPDDFVVNAKHSLKDQLFSDCSPDFVNRVEVHVVVLTQELGKIALKKYVRHMIQTGTLIWGDMKINDYGKYRTNPPLFTRPSRDSIIDRMGGGF